MSRMSIVLVCTAIVVVGCGSQRPLPPGSVITWRGQQYAVSGNTLPDSKVRCDLGKVDSSGYPSLASDAFPVCQLLANGSPSSKRTIAIHVGPGTNEIAFVVGQ